MDLVWLIIQQFYNNALNEFIESIYNLLLKKLFFIVDNKILSLIYNS